jgi:hypothetical protein
MAYPIKKTDGTQIGTIADGTVNSSITSLTLIGKNYAGYGNFLNENYVALLENFAYTNAPAAALTGQLWFDTGSLVLKVYNGSQWKPISSSASSATQPTSPVSGDLWWDSTNQQLKVWSGTAWITVGPTYTATTGTTGPIVETIKDASGFDKVVTKFYIESTVVAILSKAATFTPQTAIGGFTVVNPGFNLISSSALSGSQFTGDASNALSLQGVNASQFLRSDQNTSTAYTISAGGGVTFGSDMTISPNPTNNEISFNTATLNRDLNIYVNSANVKTRVIGITGSSAAISFANSDVTIGKTLSVTGNTSVAASAYLNILGKTVASSDIVPPNTGVVNIGASATAFNGVYATTFSGNLAASYVTIGGNLVPTLAAVTSYVQTTGQNSQGAKTVSAAAPTGGSNGDVWYRI